MPTPMPCATIQRTVLSILLLLFACGPARPAAYDVVITSGRVYDGSGNPPRIADIAVKGDRIAAIGRLEPDAPLVIDANGLAVAPGFINMLSWAGESLLHDGNSQSDIRQGVTLEVLGEGTSMGPLTPAMRQDLLTSQTHLRYAVDWTTLGQFLDHIERKGIATNVASFVGAATVRVHTLGYEDRRPTPAELDRMCSLVEQAMLEGAVGVSSALIYAPGCYADTDELIALARAAAKYDGLYISHIRSEGDKLLEALDECLAIARAADTRTEIYHLKAAGRANWHKLPDLIGTIEQARATGLRITANMYTYTAAASGLDAAFPNWVQAGGHRAWISRLRDPAIRRRVAREIETGGPDWESLYLLSGGPENVILTDLHNPALRPLIGLTLAQAAQRRDQSATETIIDLVIEDGSQVGVVYFLMSEENVRRQIALPWVSFCSDARSMATEGVFLKSSTHPRAYGSFARLLGRYVRERQVIPLEQAIRRLTALPAENLRLDRRGRLQEGHFADIVVFDPDTIIDHATYEQPHQYATGVLHVLVNGAPVLKDTRHTSAKPGRSVRGPAFRP